MNTPAATPTFTVQSKKTAVDYLFIGGAAVAVIYFGNRWLKQRKSEQESEKIGVEQQATSASEIVMAFNPSGISWLKAFDGTNAKQIMDSIIAAFNAGKKYSDIADSYKKISKGAVLLEDLRKGLSPEQFTVFGNVVRILSQRPVVKKGDSLVLKAAAIIRKTPYINGTPRLIDRRGNSIEIVDNPGTFVGISTGKQFLSIGRDTYLADSQSVATLYLEMQVVANDKKVYTVWIAASQVKIVPGAKPSSFNSVYVMKITEYNKAAAINKPYLD
ncbi:MAG: hypothetical protein WAQ28_03500 [Bacteroidia bacterium]